MTDNTTPRHTAEDIRRHFEAEMDGVKMESVRLGAMVLENTKRLTDALLENKLDLAQQVVDADDEIDAKYADLEREIFRIIALQQPVAGDLRFLISMTRVLYEIERSGDLAVNAARGLLRSNGYQLPSNVRSVLARLCLATTDLFAKGIDALADMDPTSGIRLDQEDDVVDELTGEFYGCIAGPDSQIDDLDLAIELSRAGRYMERIADHAVNIGENVTFVVTGAFPRHAVEAAADDEE
jgi:phosphate transport system protein